MKRQVAVMLVALACLASACSEGGGSLTAPTPVSTPDPPMSVSSLPPYTVPPYTPTETPDRGKLYWVVGCNSGSVAMNGTGRVTRSKQGPVGLLGQAKPGVCNISVRFLAFAGETLEASYSGTPGPPEAIFTLYLFDKEIDVSNCQYNHDCRGL